MHSTLKLPVTARKDGRGKQAARLEQEGFRKLLKEAVTERRWERALQAGSTARISKDPGEQHFFTISELYVVKYILGGRGEKLCVGCR